MFRPIVWTSVYPFLCVLCLLLKIRVFLDVAQCRLLTSQKTWIFLTTAVRTRNLAFALQWTKWSFIRTWSSSQPCLLQMVLKAIMPFVLDIMSLRQRTVYPPVWFTHYSQLWVRWFQCPNPLISTGILCWAITRLPLAYALRDSARQVSARQSMVTSLTLLETARCVFWLLHRLSGLGRIEEWSVPFVAATTYFTNFNALLTVHLSIFILIINQLDAQNLFYNKFISCLYMFRAPCAHRHRCDDTRWGM